MNDRGQAVGTSGTEEPSANDAVLWEHGVMTDLGRLGGYSATGNDINERGQVAGTSTISMAGEQHAFLWEDGVMTDLGPGYAEAVNERGQIVGVADGDDGHNTADLWDRGVVTVLGRLGTGSRCSRALDINNRGQIVGASHDDAGLVHAAMSTR